MYIGTMFCTKIASAKHCVITTPNDSQLFVLPLTLTLALIFS